MAKFKGQTMKVYYLDLGLPSGTTSSSSLGDYLTIDPNTVIGTTTSSSSTFTYWDGKITIGTLEEKLPNCEEFSL